MTTSTFNESIMPNFLKNPIKAIHKLKEAGFTQKQAEVQVELFNNSVKNELATQLDIKTLENTLRLEISKLELKLTLRMIAIVGFFYILDKFF